MKRIFRILIIAICCMVSCNMVANAGNDKPISVNALPAKAQTLLSQHFNGQKVMLATIESGVVSRSYDVVLQNGTKLEFDKKGNLTEIDCKQGIVPVQLIPQTIKNYLNDNYADQSISINWKCLLKVKSNPFVSSTSYSFLFISIFFTDCPA